MFEWDEGKAAVNLAKHGFRFMDVVEVFDGRPLLTIPSDRDAESRFVSIASLGDRMVAVIWTERGGRRRVISARRARDNEQRAYRSLHGK